MPADDVTDAWRARAKQWLEFARTPGHDVFFDQLNLPSFAELLSGPAGVFCVAIPNPVNAPAGSRARYFDEMPGSATVARDGLSMEFVWIDRPLSFYTEALASSGFVIERVREPRPSAGTVTRHPELAAARDTPFCLHLRCRRVG